MLETVSRHWPAEQWDDLLPVVRDRIDEPVFGPRDPTISSPSRDGASRCSARPCCPPPGGGPGRR
ncbi:hypothetical protein [Actinoplanes sp. NPDC049599]|uniref:hypothetical protein n=1 Tax=Actinoplanes sp. NPDC049599 TaxID=3363903 RepID=UPI0037AE0477